MARTREAAERVEKFLRAWKSMPSQHESQIYELQQDPDADEGTKLLIDDLAALIEAGLWLDLMGTVGGVHREYCEATVEPISDDDARIISRDVSVPERTAAEWNGAGIAPRAFVAQRLVSDWERRA